MNLTYEDYDFILEALDAKASEASTSGMMSGMLGMMVSKDKDEAEGIMTEALDKGKEKDQLIKERIVLLKAKIITLRDRVMISELETKS